MKNKYLENTIKKYEEGQIDFKSVGKMKVLRAYNRAKIEDKLELEFNDLFFESELEGAYEVIRDAKIDSFLTFDDSTALMKTIHFFLKKGFKVEPTLNGFKKGLRFYL